MDLNTPINVINLDIAQKRLLSIEQQSKEQGFSYNRWSAIKMDAIPFMGCSISHKNIVSYAKQKGLEYVCIAEDDLLFYGIGAWQFFVNNVPPSFDLYLGEVHYNSEMKPTISKDNRVGDFCGLTLYVVHNRFYDTFLSMDSKTHLDRALGAISENHEYYVCNPMVCRQSNGFSYMKKSEVNYDEMYNNTVFFNNLSQVFH
jgi:hypothetical protein